MKQAILIGLVALGACGPVSEASRGDASVPALEQTSSALVTGHQNFGSTSRGTNFECLGSTCLCDDTTLGNHGPDCQALLVAHCTASDLVCTVAPTGRAVCICMKDCWNGPQNCMVTMGVLEAGWYTATPSFLRRLPHGDRSCQLSTQQYNDLRAAGKTFQVITGAKLENAWATYSGQICSGVEAGLQTDTLTGDGMYRSFGGKRYRKSGMRACVMSDYQYQNILGSPPLTQMSSSGTLDFQRRYSTTGGVDPIDCRDMDL